MSDRGDSQPEGRAPFADTGALGLLPPRIAAFVVGPIIAVVAVSAISLATGSDADNLPLELAAPAAAMSCVWAGVVAGRSGARSHAWWALGGGVLAVVLFAVEVALLSG